MRDLLCVPSYDATDLWKSAACFSPLSPIRECEHTGKARTDVMDEYRAPPAAFLGACLYMGLRMSCHSQADLGW